jgi:tetratricopeptide (TPR) repeat protein
MKIRIKSLAFVALVIGCFALGFSLYAQTKPQLTFNQNALQQSYNCETRGDYRGALSQIQPVLERQPNHYFCLMRSGWLNLCLRAYSEAFRSYNEAARTCPQAAEPAIGAIKAAAALGDWKSVESLARSVLEKDPGNYTALSNLAYACCMKKDYPTAAQHYSKLLTLYPSDLDMRNGYAWSLYYAGKKGDAKAQFVEVLDVSPANSSANEGLAACSK